MLKAKEKIHRVIELLPRHIAEEIIRISSGRVAGLSGIREIRIRRGGVCTLLIGRENIRLYGRVDADMTAEIVDRLLGGALYAHRDSIASGYISLKGGIRVGICGSAAYEGGRLVGVSDMRSLLFRIPSGECAFIDRLYEIFLSGIGSGMLIYSPPGVGKTTALRALARRVGSGQAPLRVCVVDERCEFDENDYTDCEVDILGGYKKRQGIEIATRTMSPQLIMIDEIGAEDAEAITDVIKCGIPIVATAHAGSREELISKTSLAPLFKLSAFSILVGISRVGDSYSLTSDKA